MQHTDFFARIRAIKTEEYKELQAAVELHGGIYEWDLRNPEHPVIAVNLNGIIPAPADVRIYKVYIRKGMLKLCGVEKEYGEELSKIAKDDFINLVDKTTIAQLGALLANCKALISVDTGTMHLGLAVDVPTVCLFYIHTKAHLDAWAPEKSLYRCEVLTENIKVENIVNSLRKIME